jgi:hypothetical protein
VNAAFAEGLLSDQTLSYRLGLVFGPRLVEPRRVVGDLALRDHRPSGRLASFPAAVRRGLARLLGRRLAPPAEYLLALDWSGARSELLVGRAAGCDIALDHPTVSRHHARLVFRDGGWMVQDLGSKNGVTINGVRVGRCALRPGDRVGLGLQLVEVD